MKGRSDRDRQQYQAAIENEQSSEHWVQIDAHAMVLRRGHRCEGGKYPTDRGHDADGNDGEQDQQVGSEALASLPRLS